MHELSLSSAIVDTVVKHAAGRQVTVVNLRVGRLRQVVPDSLEFYFGFVAAGHRLRGRPARAGARPGAPALRRLRARVGDRLPLLPLPGLRRPDVEVVSGDEFEVESIEVEEAECTAPR